MISKSEPVQFDTSFLHGGKFELIHSGTVVVDGYVRIPQVASTALYENMIDKLQTDDQKYLETKDIYKELRVRGYDYGQTFQGLSRVSFDGSHGQVKWMGNWVSFR